MTIKQFASRGLDVLKTLIRAPAAAVVTLAIGLEIAVSNVAHAYSLGDAASGMNSQLNNLAKLAVDASFVFGLVTMTSGLNKLKVHYDSQGRDAKAAEGWGRLAIGSGLTAVPWLTGIGLSTLFNNGTQSTPTAQSVNVP